MRLQVRFLPLLAVFLTLPVLADDGAASIAAGGLVIMKHEPRIVMAKEVLQISAKEVIVDYDFRNDSDENITTEVAFPIPDYEFNPDLDGNTQGFDDFRLWIDGSPVHYQVEARAFVKDKEYTTLLNEMHVDVASYGHGPVLDDGGNEVRKSKDIARLSPAQRDRLRKAGLIAQDWADEPK